VPDLSQIDYGTFMDILQVIFAYSRKRGEAVVRRMASRRKRADEFRGKITNKNGIVHGAASLLPLGLRPVKKYFPPFVQTRLPRSSSF
jgi:hypothetical protein